MEGDNGTVMITEVIPDSLQSIGAFDDTVVRATVKAKPRTDYRYIKREKTPEKS